VILAAPVACCLFITSLILAMMAKAAPQLNLMSCGFALRLLVGLVATWTLWPNLAPRMNVILQQYSGLLIGR